MNSLKRHPHQAGFSLIELLTVMAILAIISGVGFVSVQGNSTAAALGGGESLAASMIQNARNLAILKNTSTRLLVSNDTGSDSHYLRGISIVYATKNTASVTQWTSATKLDTLPPGVFFNPTRSGHMAGTDMPTMNLTLPATTATPGSGPSWYYYEFAASGAIDIGTEAFVVVAGHLSGSGSSLAIVSPKVDQARGFVIRRLGTVAYFESPTQIPQ